MGTGGQDIEPAADEQQTRLKFPFVLHATVKVQLSAELLRAGKTLPASWNIKPRSLKSIGSWKAVEWAYWVFCYSTPLLAPHLPANITAMWTKYVQAVRLSIQTTITSSPSSACFTTLWRNGKQSLWASDARVSTPCDRASISSYTSRTR